MEDDFGLERRFEWEGKLEDVVERRYGVRDFMEVRKGMMAFGLVWENF